MTADELQKKQDIDNASALGGKSYQDGVEWYRNPFDPGTYKHQAWVDGWRMERDYWGSK